MPDLILFDKIVELMNSVRISVINIFHELIFLWIFCMKLSVWSLNKINLLLAFLIVYSTNYLHGKDDKKSYKSDSIQLKADNLVVDLNGKLNNETFFANNMNFLQGNVANDSTFFIRTTFDLVSIFSQGNYEQPRIVFYEAIRFRFKWGSVTDIRNDTSSVTVSNTKFDIRGTTTNKHLLWMRESWVKMRLGTIDDHNNYVQIGLIPYQVGRGISLGAAYEALGFLGFAPGSSIDQYAPAILFSFNPIPDRFLVDFYAALVENKQTSISENLEVIRANELGNACGVRGVGRQSYILALRSAVCLYQTDTEKVSFEPYIVHQHAPDQDLEFANDVDSFVSTVGAAIEGEVSKINWGFEAACNFGEIDIKPWDRNKIKITKNSDGFLIEQYTKVFTQDPATVVCPSKATYTTAIATLLAGSPQDRSENGKLIGTIPGSPATNIYNAFDRFRPAQQRNLSGYFFVADATYNCIPKVFDCSLGVGYASGFIDLQRDTNVMTPEELMSEPFTAFLPLQSVYSGKRLRHLVLFNQGVPRFNVKNPNDSLYGINVTSVLQTDTVNEMTNIAFVGTRLNWNVQALKKYAFNIAQNVIAYWAPETAHFPTKTSTQVLSVGNEVTVFDATEQSDHFIGTEFTTEFSALFYEKIKVAGYFGVLFPGQHYKDMSGVIIRKYDSATGCDIGYVGNFGVAYFF